MILGFILYPIIQACDFDEEISIYPIKGEKYQLLMQDLFGELPFQYSCKGCPRNVNVYNAINQIGNDESNEYNFKCVGSNNTHFAALTNNQTLNLYVFYDNQLSLQEVFTLQNNLTCFSVEFTFDDWIVLDCYSNGYLYLFKYTQVQLVSVYNQSLKNFPINTQLQSLLIYNSPIILYAQYFSQFQILTLLIFQSNVFKNQTTLQESIIDFTVSKETNFIYVIQSKLIHQIIISTDYTFKTIKKEVSSFPLTKVVTYHSLSLYSECDQLLLLAENNNILQGCGCLKYLFIEEQVLLSNQNIQVNQNVQLLANLRFIILTNQKNMAIYLRYIPQQNIIYDFYSQENNINFNTLYYFDQNNDILFTFGKRLSVFQIKNPQLSGIFETTKTKKFQIFALYWFQFQLHTCSYHITYHLLESNDTQVYVTQNFHPNVNLISQNQQLVQPLNIFSGSLIQIKGQSSNESLGYFSFQQLTEVQYFQQLEWLKNLTMFYLQQKINFNGYLIVGFDQSNIYFFFYAGPKFKKVYQNSSSLLTNNFTQIQITFNFQQFFYVGINNNTSGIQLFQVWMYNHINYQYIDTINEQFSQFLLTYNKIILLLLNQSLLIMNYDQTQKQFVSQKEILKFYSQIKKFQPSQIEMNSQFQSNIIFINNIKNIIILGLEYNSEITPINLIDLEQQQIQFIKIVNNKLVIYSRDINLVESLQVWNIENARKPYFEKIMNIPENVQINYITSDNLFFYLLTTDQKIYVYNPNVPSHSTLYVKFDYDGKFFSSCFVQKSSLLTFNNKVYDLSPIPLAIYQPYQNINSQQIISENIFNYSLQTSLNSSFIQTTNNQSLSIVNTFTFLSNQNIFVQVQNRTIQKSFSQLEINSNSQILNFNLTNLQNNYCECNCRLKNTLSKIDEANLDQTFKALTLVNDQFVLQNDQQLQIFNSTILYNFTQDEQCDKSTSKYNYFYIMCKHNQFSISLLVFSISPEEIELVQTYQLSQIFSIQQILVYFDISFILGAELSKQIGIYIFIPNGYVDGNQNYSFITTDQNCSGLDVINIYNQTIKNVEFCKLIIFYICQENVYYQIADYNIQKQQLKLESENQLLLPWLQNQNIVDIFVNKIENFEMLLLIAYRNSFNAMFTLLYNQIYQQIFVEDLVSILPTYGNYNLSNIQLVKGFLLMIYSYEIDGQSSVSIIIYNLSEITQGQTRLIIGGIQLESVEYQSILASINSLSISSGQLLLINNRTYQLYELSTFQLNCTFYVTSIYRDATCIQSLEAINSFSQSQIDLIFQFQKIEINDCEWIYILICLMAISLVTFCWNMKNRNYPNNAFEFQFEL